MFFSSKQDEALRFGDVIEGFVLSCSELSEINTEANYNINVELPQYCVVFDPCCSIGDKTISVNPLLRIRSSFFDNPYFYEDLTRINKEMEPIHTLPPHAWESMEEDVKQRKLSLGKGYAFHELFMYQGNDLFSEYEVHRKNADNINTNYYMINFKNSYKIKCGKINSAKNSPLEIKRLQLSIKSREELRQKVAHFFARVPQEDQI